MEMSQGEAPTTKMEDLFKKYEKSVTETILKTMQKFKEEIRSDIAELKAAKTATKATLDNMS